MAGVFDGVFWGVVLIALGAWFMLRRYIPVQIPVVRILIAVLFIYVGIRVLIQGPVIRDHNTVVFSRTTIPYTPESGRDYNVIFSSGTVDLSSADVGSSGARAEVNVIFGSGVLRIDAAAPVRVTMSSAFGSVEAPNGSTVAFGDADYRTASYRDGAPALEVRATAVFGRLVIQSAAQVSPQH